MGNGGIWFMIFLLVSLSVIWCETLSRSGLVQLVGNFGEVGMVALQFGI